MPNPYDLIIVGAGPAGTTAALYADQMGLKSVLVDKATFPRDKICGDAISGKSIRYMNELGILDEVSDLDGAEINRITFGSPSHKQFDIHLNKNDSNIKKGFVIPRQIFDNFLLEKAQNVTTVKDGFKVKDILYENDKIIGVRGEEKGEAKELEAPIILGCDGANSFVARKLGLYQSDMKNTSIAIRCYYKGVKGLSDQIELHFVKEVLPGYFWLFPAGDDLANIGIGLTKADAKKEKRTLREILDEVTKSEYFRDRFSDAKPMEVPLGWNLPLGRIKRKNYGSGFMLLGDAAGLVDPFTGEGIGNAMVSAKYAVEVAAKAIKANDCSASVLSEYSSLVWDEIGNELNTSSKLQDLAKYKYLLNFVINRSSQSRELQEIISGMLINKFPREKLSNPMFYLKILFS